MSQPVYQIQIKLGANYPVATDELVVGTISSCAIALRDPVASEEHCRFSRTPNGFLVEDLGSATGTWVNGVPCDVPARLADGDTVVVGVSRMTVKHAGAVLEITVEEAEFQYTKSGAGGAQREADDWVRSEVTFGRIPAIRMSGWIAAALTLVFVAMAALGPFGSDMLMPGPLRSVHAELFSEDPEVLRAKFGDARANAALLAQEQGCAICHDSFGGTTWTNCGTCHSDKTSAETHPFHAEPGSFPKGELASDSCILCHSEHHTDSGLLRASKESLPDCDACHADDHLADVRSLAGKWASSTVELSAPPKATRAPVAYRDFDHSAHLARDIACGTCHSMVDEVATGDDFATVPFETCMQCHSASAGPSDATLAAVASQVPADLKFDLAWHGTDDGTQHCEQCHTSEPRTGAFRTVESPEVGSGRFRLTRRHHGEVFSERKCIECHRTGTPSVEEGVVEARFVHGVHLAALDPGGDDALAEALSENCAACHADQASSSSLLADRGAQNYHGLVTSQCSKCHHDGEDNPLIESVVPGEGLGTVQRRDFPHAAHVGKVEGGCFRCHEFARSDDPFSALPMTRESVKSCVECHGGHSNLGGGDCAVCHESAGGVVAGVFRTDSAMRDNKPDAALFDHRRAGEAGHFGFVQRGECTHCHVGMAEATDVPSIQLPFRPQAACQPCHGGAFHFSRGSE